MMQSLIELDARGGTRYVEILKSHFNKKFCITLRFPHFDFEKVTKSAEKGCLSFRFGELCEQYKNEYECYRPINADLAA